MKDPIRSARRGWAPLLVAVLLITTPLIPGASAQTTEDGEETQLTKQEERERAKQARIEEYLRKREERIAEKDLKRREQEAAKATGAAAAAGTTAVATSSKKKKKKGDGEIVLPKDLAEAQAIIRGNEIAQDPTVAAYLDLIDQAEASPQQLAAFGNFLADYGTPRIALVYYRVALSIEKNDPLLWLNMGTLYRKVQEPDAAIDAFSRALSIDPNLAFGHYNLGATLDDLGKYDEAIEEYRVALALDPTLGDPKVNPQAANNERLLAVKLMLYQEQIGNQGLPLVDVPGGELASPRPDGN